MGSNPTLPTSFMSSKNKFYFFYALSIAFQLGFFIAIPIVLFIIGGVFLDKIFHSFPLFLIICVVLSLVFTIFTVIDLLLPFLKKHKNRK